MFYLDFEKFKKNQKVLSLFFVINLDPIFYQIQQTTTDYEWKQVFTIDRKSYFVPVKTASHNKKN